MLYTLLNCPPFYSRVLIRFQTNYCAIRYAPQTPLEDRVAFEMFFLSFLTSYKEAKLVEYSSEDRVSHYNLPTTCIGYIKHAQCAYFGR